MASILDFDWQSPIVDRDTGRPTSYFLDMIKGHKDYALDTEEALTLLQTTVAGKADKVTTMTAGTGLSGGGSLAANRTFNLNAGIDLLTDVDTTTTPPTNGQVLMWDNAAGLWKPGTAAGGGGGGALAIAATGTISSLTTDIAGLDTVNYDYKLVISLNRPLAGAVAADYIRIQFGDTAATPTWNVTAGFISASGTVPANLTSVAGIVRVAQVQNNTTLYMGTDLDMKFADTGKNVSMFGHSYFWENQLQYDQGPIGSQIGAIRITTVNQTWAGTYILYKVAKAASGVPAGSGLTMINRQVLAASTAAITFSAIPAIYEDLLLILEGRSTNAGAEVRAQFNGDTAANYDFTRENRFGTASGIAAAYIETASLPPSTMTANYPSGVNIEIPGYARTAFYKMLRARSETATSVAAAGLFSQSTQGWWRNTAAITAINLFLQTGATVGNFVAGTVATLYGRV
jgi:hypothetical protein